MINELQLCADDSKFGSDFASSCDGFQSVTEVEANGVGSLLAMMQGGGSDYVGYYFADANGNITRMYGTKDQELTSYRYDPFGNITDASGSWAIINRYQWSSKENDASTGLVYYLYRFYSPELGRWVNRDPIEEAGGVNLYGMVGNDLINWIDFLGLARFMGTTQDGKSFDFEANSLDELRKGLENNVGNAKIKNGELRDHGNRVGKDDAINTWNFNNKLADALASYVNKDSAVSFDSCDSAGESPALLWGQTREEKSKDSKARVISEQLPGTYTGYQERRYGSRTNIGPRWGGDEITFVDGKIKKEQ